MYEPDGKMYESEDAYLDTMKRDDSYHFSVAFEYIETNHGNDVYDIASTTMEVDVTWSDWNHGYDVSYSCPDENDIDPSQGNGNLDEFFDSAVRDKVEELIAEEGIPPELMIW